MIAPEHGETFLAAVTILGWPIRALENGSMPSVMVRADRALEAAERLLAELKQSGHMDDWKPDIESIVAACRIAMKPSFGDRTGLITLTGSEAAWLLPHFQEPPEL
jgi:hypothetical protein